jgi:hypothetical protein
MGILLILGRRVRTSWRRSGVAYGSAEIGYESLGSEWTNTGADNTPGGITRHDTRGIAMVMKVHANAYPQGDFVSFDSRGQIAEKSSRRRDYGGHEDPKGEGEAFDGGVKWLDESVLLERVDQREPSKSLGEEKKTVREHDVVGVPFVRKQ